MNRKILITVTGFLIMASLSSCSQEEIIPESLLQEIETQGCCGEGEIDPPPPPPPPPGGSSGG